MTLTYGFYNSVSNDREYDAIDMSRLFDGIILDGVYAALGDYFLVTENSIPDMNVIVGTGRAWFDHTWSYNDADVVLPVTTADALLPRIDVVYLEVNEDSGVRANKLDILDGTPASTPVAPTLTNTTTVHQYPLAHIYVGAAVSTITNANLTNKVGTTECPFVTCPLTYVTTNDLLAQWESEWEQWFNDIKDQLSTEAETNLQAQIWDLAGVESGAPPYATDMVSLSTHDHSSEPGDQIPTAGLENGAVTNAKLAANAVSETRIVDGAVTENKIGNSAVSTGKIAALAIIENRIADNAVTPSKIPNRSDYKWVGADSMSIKSGASYGDNSYLGHSLTMPNGVLSTVQGSFLIPARFVDSILSAYVVFGSPINSATVEFDFTYKILGQNDPIDSAVSPYNWQTLSLNIGSGTRLLTIGTLGSMMVQEPDINDVCIFQLNRDGAGDAHSGDIYLVGMRFYYQVDS